MRRSTLNLGILAHVDAGKTTLTERLLLAAGAIDEAGSVDAGTTQTDSMELERQRGITIRSAVASLQVDGVAVNLIDTPGHPDFIAEVERVLTVLDGAVLVVSAVEGVQPQTRVLMRALQRLRVPTIVFVNKIDRRGADPDRVLRAIAARLTPDGVAMGTVRQPGTPTARFVPYALDDFAFRARLTEMLSGHDDELLAAYVDDEASLTATRLRAELAAQTTRTHLHPVFFGSAVTGEGVQPLMAALVELLPTAAGSDEGPAVGRIFKVERGPTGEKIAYVRMFSGVVRPRDRLRSSSGAADKVTAISAFDRGDWVRRPSVGAGEVAKVWGLGAIRVGDAVRGANGTGAAPTTDAAADRNAGAATGTETGASFPPPTLATVVVPRRAADKAALKVALTHLAEQDPLIAVRQDEVRQELTVSLYGEVQKEVVQATLAAEYGLDVTFRESTTICIERPTRTGEAVEILNADTNPFLATIGLRVDPAPYGSGVDFRLAVDPRSVPTYLFQSAAGFAEAMGQYVRRALHEGRYGWEVTDCVVTMVECRYSSWDGPPSLRGPLSAAADFRKLTPMVLMAAVARAAPVVCEPIVRARLEVPDETLGPVLAVLARLGAVVRAQDLRNDLATVEAVLPAARVPGLARQLPGLTGGEGVLESTFEGYRPVRGEPPVRPRTMPDPLHRVEYLNAVGRQVAHK